MPAKLLTTAQIAAELGCSQNNVRRLADYRKLGSYLAGRRVFTVADLAAMRIRDDGTVRNGEV